MYIEKQTKVVLIIGIVLLIIGAIVEGIRYIKYGKEPELKRVKIEQTKR